MSFVCSPTALPPCLVALDTATEAVHLALCAGGQVRSLALGGGAQASNTTLPGLNALLAQETLAWADVQAVAFGQGPGAFTGLRTACAIAQGLALGLDLPVIAIDTLMAVAEAARQAHADIALALAQTPQTLLWVLQDARMSEVYAAAYTWAGGRWQQAQAPALWPLAHLRERIDSGQITLAAGSALKAYPQDVQGLLDQKALLAPDAQPHGQALAVLALQAWQAGAVLDAALALPLYVRNKVAQTTAERTAKRPAELAAPSPCASPWPLLRPMTQDDIPGVLAMEQAACMHSAHAWSEGNYRSSLASGYWMRVVCGPSGVVHGVVVAMLGVDELHLLNIAVGQPLQGQGLGGHLLNQLISLCHSHQMRSVWLEVRPSNARATAVYTRHGYVVVGLRKGYYPGPGAREDAVVMKREVPLDAPLV